MRGHRRRRGVVDASVVFDRVMLGFADVRGHPVGCCRPVIRRSVSSVNRSVVAVLVGALNLVLLWLASGFAQAGPGGSADRLAAHPDGRRGGPVRSRVVLPLDGTDFVATFSAGGGRCPVSRWRPGPVG